MNGDAFWSAFWLTYEPLFHHLNDYFPVASFLTVGVAVSVAVVVISYVSDRL